jgi:hypothetical protein
LRCELIFAGKWYLAACILGIDKKPVSFAGFLYYNVCINIDVFEEDHREHLVGSARFECLGNYRLGIDGCAIAHACRASGPSHDGLLCPVGRHALFDFAPV